MLMKLIHLFTTRKPRPCPHGWVGVRCDDCYGAGLLHSKDTIYG